MDALELTLDPTTEIDETLRKVREVLPAIRSRRQEIESERRMPRDLVEALARTGMFRLGVPRDLGGLEAPLSNLMRAIELVSTADASAGWCAMIATANGTTAGYLNDAGAREMFADPSAPTAGIASPGGAAVRVDGGIQVSGRWSFASGITHCDWLWAGCMVMENGQPRMTEAGPEILHIAIPTRDVQIHDTWHVSGLCGTGSNDFSVKDLFVPDRRTFLLIDPRGHRPEPLYQYPALAAFASSVASVSLGVARAAIDEFVEIAQTKVPTLYMTPIADRPLAQTEVARAEAALGAARAYLYQVVEEVWDTLAAGDTPTLRQVAMNRIAILNVTQTAADVTRAINVMAGGSSIYSGSSLQRHARDAEAILHHFTVAPHAWEESGRVLLGRTPNVPIF